MKTIIKNLGLILCLSVISCDIDTDLNVENQENPNDKILTSDPVALEAKTATLFKNWYMSNTGTSAPGFAMNTMADVSTCSWGNFGMRDLSSEPRVAFNNSVSYGNDVTNAYFNALYTVLFDSNTINAAISNGTEFENPALISSMAKFGQALAIGYNALNFDTVYLSDETGPVGEGPVDYTVAMEFALEKLDDAIAIAKANSFSVPSEWMPGNSMSNTDFAKLLNSFGARLLVLNARNSTEKASTDWNRVKDYAEKGITSDFSILHDDVNWFDLFKTYLVYPGWARIDLYVINMMDPNYPDYWPADKTILPEANSADARLESDFSYLNSQSFRPERGTYHYSSYRYSRFDDYISEWTIPTIEFAVAENDMYKAEAYLNLGQLGLAANVINNGTRSTRGELSDIAATTTEIAKAIHYERMVELGLNSPGLSFYEMRKEDLLQEGTLLHFPIPGKALQSIPAEYYTYGGTSGEAGLDYSTGGWR